MYERFYLFTQRTIMQGLVSNRVAVCWKRKVILWIKILTIFLSYVRPLSTSRIIFITFHASSRVALCIFYAFRILQIPRALYFSFVFLYSPDFLILLSFLYFFPFLRLALISFDQCTFQIINVVSMFRKTGSFEPGDSCILQTRRWNYRARTSYGYVEKYKP